MTWWEKLTGAEIIELQRLRLEAAMASGKGAVDAFLVETRLDPVAPEVIAPVLPAFAPEKKTTLPTCDSKDQKETKRSPAKEPVKLGAKKAEGSLRAEVRAYAITKFTEGVVSPLQVRKAIVLKYGNSFANLSLGNIHYWLKVWKSQSRPSEPPKVPSPVSSGQYACKRVGGADVSPASCLEWQKRWRSPQIDAKKAWEQLKVCRDCGGYVKDVAQLSISKDSTLPTIHPKAPIHRLS